MPVNGNPAGHPLAVFHHDYIAPICANFMDPQKLQLDWWYWLWKPTKQTVEVLFKWNEKNFLFKTQISLIFSCVHFSQGKIPTKKKKTRQNSPPKNGRVLGEFLASRRVFFTRPHTRRGPGPISLVMVTSEMTSEMYDKWSLVMTSDSLVMTSESLVMTSDLPEECL